MGTTSTKVQQSNTQPTQYDLKIIPNKIIYNQTDEIRGQVILDMYQPFNRPGILIIALDAKEQFEYSPSPHRSSNSFRNEHKFIREREVLAQFLSISVGRHVFNFNFSLASNQRVPPSVQFNQEIKGHGNLDLKCSYKLSCTIYDTSSRVDKVEKSEFPIIVRALQNKNAIRNNFIEMGQSEIFNCLGGLGSGGICSFQVKCVKDSFQTDELIQFFGRLDNSRSKSQIKKVEVRLLRYIRLHTSLANNNPMYDNVIIQELYKQKFDGVQARHKDYSFVREFSIALDEIFSKERQCQQGTINIDNLSNLAPSSQCKTFMIHYAIQVSLKHSGFFKTPTSLEIDINIDFSKKDQKIFEHWFNDQLREKSNRPFINGPVFQQQNE